MEANSAPAALLSTGRSAAIREEISAPMMEHTIMQVAVRVAINTARAVVIRVARVHTHVARTPATHHAVKAVTIVARVAISSARAVTVVKADTTVPKAISVAKVISVDVSTAMVATSGARMVRSHVSTTAMEVTASMAAAMAMASVLPRAGTASAPRATILMPSTA